jgi:CRP-like cAMP-binding protein
VDETGDDLTASSASAPPIDPLLAPHLTDQQLDLLRQHGGITPTVAGQELFREGDRSYDFIVILSGTVTIIDHQAGVERELATGGPGEFVAELNLLTGERLFTTAVVKQAGSILVVPVERLHAVIGRDQALGDLIVQTLFRRRQWLVQARAGGDYAILLESGDRLVARSVIIATGVSYRKLDAIGLDRFDGVGVFYTPLTAQDNVDAGVPIVIVGGGNSAGQAATSLADHGHPVTIVIRGDDLAASMRTT